MADPIQTEERKANHINFVLKENVAAKGVTTGFERYFFEHQALGVVHKAEKGA